MVDLAAQTNDQASLFWQAGTWHRRPLPFRVSRHSLSPKLDFCAPNDAELRILVLQSGRIRDTCKANSRWVRWRIRPTSGNLAFLSHWAKTAHKISQPPQRLRIKLWNSSFHHINTVEITHFWSTCKIILSYFQQLGFALVTLFLAQLNKGCHSCPQTESWAFAKLNCHSFNI